MASQQQQQPQPQQQPNRGGASLQDVVTQLKAINSNLSALITQLKANG